MMNGGLNIDLSRKDLEDFASQNIDLQGLDCSRISSVFLGKLYAFYYQRVVDLSCITREMRVLESGKNKSVTRKPEKFKHDPLKGLMKKHFTAPNFLLQNMGNYFSMDYGGNKRLDDIIKRQFDKNTSGFVDDAFCAGIANAFVFESIASRERKKEMTGEWIVYKVHNGKNYYLTISSHNQENEEIYKDVKLAYEFDFNFLSDVDPAD